MTGLVAVLHHPGVIAAWHGAVIGGAGAAVADWRAFRSWKTWHDAETYDWGIATFRWFQGAAMGASAAIVASWGGLV